MRSLHLIAAASLIIASAATAQGQIEDDPLPRRGFFGVGLGPDESGQGVLVTQVVPGSTAEAASLAAGDILTSVDGAATATPEAVIAAMARRRAGDVVAIDYRRDGEAIHIEPTLKTLPQEQMANAVLEYGSVTTADGVRLRTILSVPADTRASAPAVMLIQGGGCGSIDTPIGPPIAQPGLTHVIGAAGFVTLRVEKSGVGDSEGPPCAEIGYREELAGYRAGLDALLGDPRVDGERVFLLGVSLGGVFAPILANETPVAGIVTYGTINFAPTGYPGRSERFFSEFASVDVLGEWAGVDTPVLLLRGEFDEGVEAGWSASIAAAVNAAHPGRAEHRELAGLDHCWTRHASMAESAGRCGQGEETSDLSETILAFLREQS